MQLVMKMEPSRRRAKGLQGSESFPSTMWDCSEKQQVWGKALTASNPALHADLRLKKMTFVKAVLLFSSWAANTLITLVLGPCPWSAVPVVGIGGQTVPSMPLESHQSKVKRMGYGPRALSLHITYISSSNNQSINRQIKLWLFSTCQTPC